MQRQTNVVKHVGFVLKGVINTYNKRINHNFRRGVAELVAARKYSKPSDFISVNTAKELILVHTGKRVCHCTAIRWVAQNGLGSKLSGYKGQWIVDAALFSDFLNEIICH